MMVNLKKPIACRYGSGVAGDTMEVPHEVATQWIEDGAAVPVVEKKSIEKATFDHKPKGKSRPKKAKK